ncbi:DUF3185 family protein [Pseudohongiella sp.]|uniref:DUF3185 family protein n=1 Tax=marine sediment metagenome TaxID=412755 RepID=A0A0F9W2L6_9ZZZZ|nr:DUF3185 family protein [Pseudohongiella sp.]HDZ09248.1 DUF3185 family protein [Pseudohongiella sp.]HEA62112.1 DUF3185 family protein [Pseudohongiella sp.]
MPSKQLLGLILLVVGAILLYFGWQSTQSVGDQLTEAMTGRFTDETMWLLIGGAIALVVGAFYTFGRR